MIPYKYNIIIASLICQYNCQLYDSYSLFIRINDIVLRISAQIQAQNNVYEVLSDVNSRQDIMDERISNLEDRINSIQVSLDVLPDILTRCIQQQFEFNNFQPYGQHNTSQQQHHHQTSSSQSQQQTASLSTSIKQPIQPQHHQQQQLALTHQQQQPSSFQDGDFATLQLASSPSPNNQTTIPGSGANNTTTMSGQQQQQQSTTTTVPYASSQPQIWQQQQAANVSVPSTASSNWQTTNPALSAPATIGQSKQSIQSHIINRPPPSVHPPQHQIAPASASSASSAVTLTSSSTIPPGSQPPTNSQPFPAHHRTTQPPQMSQQHMPPPPAYNLSAPSTGRTTSSSIPTMAPLPPLPPRSHLDSSGKPASCGGAGNAPIPSGVSSGGTTAGVSSVPTSGFQHQQSKTDKSRHSHHQDQHKGPNTTS